MKVYSNIPLSWPSLLHMYTVPRLSLHPWNNYHFYKIISSYPVKINNISPIKLLTNNIDYYCYFNVVDWKYQHKSHNYLVNIKLNMYNEVDIEKNKEKVSNMYVKAKCNNFENNYIYIPKCIEQDDLIVIKDFTSNTHVPYRSYTSGTDIILA